MKAELTMEVLNDFQIRASQVSNTKGYCTVKDKRWLADYIRYFSQMLEAWQNVEREKMSGSRKTSNQGSSSLESADVLYEPEQIVKPQPPPNVAKQGRLILKKENLVKNPVNFDGIKLPARKWIDNFENAAEINSWSDAFMVKFFSSWLDRSANDWYVTVGKRKLGSQPTWKELPASFIRHYIGDSDKLVLRREMERT